MSGTFEHVSDYPPQPYEPLPLGLDDFRIGTTWLWQDKPGFVIRASFSEELARDGYGRWQLCPAGMSLNVDIETQPAGHVDAEGCTRRIEDIVDRHPKLHLTGDGYAWRLDSATLRYPSTFELSFYRMVER